jgi:hypothetical protein
MQPSLSTLIDVYPFLIGLWSYTGWISGVKNVRSRGIARVFSALCNQVSKALISWVFKQFWHFGMSNCFDVDVTSITILK